MMACMGTTATPWSSTWPFTFLLRGLRPFSVPTLHPMFFFLSVTPPPQVFLRLRLRQPPCLFLRVCCFFAVHVWVHAKFQFCVRGRVPLHFMFALSMCIKSSRTRFSCQRFRTTGMENTPGLLVAIWVWGNSRVRVLRETNSATIV